MFSELRHASRIVSRSPRYAFSVAFILALGIGANTLILSVVSAVLSRPLPFKDQDRIVVLWESQLNRGISRGIISPADYLEWTRRTHSFEHVAAWRTWFYTLHENGAPEQVWGVHASAGFFEILGVQPQLGRTLLPGDDSPGRDKVVVISHALWQRRYSSSPDVIGTTITIDDGSYAIVGVLRPDFDLFGTTRSYDIWMPFVMTEGGSRMDHSILVFGKLKAGASPQSAEAEMDTIMRDLERENPTGEQRNIRVVRLKTSQVENIRPTLLVLMAAVGLLLIISCANVANLMLARAALRRREVAIRVALGASHSRLGLYFFSEGLVLASVGGALGILLAIAGMGPLRNAVLHPGLAVPRAQFIHIDHNVVACAAGLVLLTAVLLSLAPIAHTFRSNAFDSLRAVGLATSSHRKLRSALVVAEIGLSTALLFCAILLSSSAAKLIATDPGVTTTNILTLRLWLPGWHFSTPGDLVRFQRQAILRLSVLPGVTSASGVNFPPLSGWGDATTIEIPSYDQSRIEQSRLVTQYRVVTPNYFATMQVPLRLGRYFTDADTEQGAPAAIINEEMARRYWPHSEILGTSVILHFPASGAPWKPAAGPERVTVVGVVADVKEFGPAQPDAPQIYLPYSQFPSRLFTFLLQTGVEPRSLATSAVAVIHQMDAEQAVSEIKTMDEYRSDSTTLNHTSALMVSLFAVFAFMLATTGLYASVSYSFAQRRFELAIRAALGATPSKLRILVFVEASSLIVNGVVLGSIIGLVGSRALKTLLFGVRPDDLSALGIVALVMVITGMAACWVPMRKALKLDPMESLRHE
ncbi:MAG TPA: ABC transporter permease [Candidatus Dormibacteraeota bacterium]|nr:ABC transporter permease [Candidatus Dormibacteraeota bacterium]